MWFSDLLASPPHLRKIRRSFIPVPFATRDASYLPQSMCYSLAMSAFSGHPINDVHSHFPLPSPLQFNCMSMLFFIKYCGLALHTKHKLPLFPICPCYLYTVYMAIKWFLVLFCVSCHFLFFFLFSSLALLNFTKS